VLKFLQNDPMPNLNQTVRSNLNPELSMISTSVSCPPGHILFEDFITYAKTRGGLKTMKPRDEEYLRARLTVDGE
jgi:hypothetical protein